MHRLLRDRIWVLGVGCWSIVALCSVCALAQTQPTVTVRPVVTPTANVLLLVDGKLVELETIQIQRGQQVMVWIRELEKLGWGTVDSAAPDRTTFKGNGITLSFTKGMDTAMVNSLVVRLPIDIYMRDGKLMVPLSFVAKALGYQYDCTERPVATILTSPPKAPVKTTNTIQGKVLYNGEGAAGITVRAVDPQFTVVKNATVKTDANGEYKIENLPDGTYMAYVYTGDNPGFFNRASEQVEAKGGNTFDVQPIALGRVISPTMPKPGSAISLSSQERVGVRSVQKGMVEFAWSTCEGAAAYNIAIKKKGADKAVAEASVAKPEAHIPASLFVKGASYEAQVTAENAAGDNLGGTAGTGGKLWAFSVK